MEKGIRATRFVALVAALALSAQPSLSAQDLKRALADKVSQLAAEPPVTTVSSSGNLQAALAIGGTIELQPGARFEGSRFVVVKSGTVLRGRGASLHGTDGPGLYIPPNVDDVRVEDTSVTSGWPGAVIQCGDNGPTQVAADQVPQRITFANITIPTHRGKRGIEVNCSATIINPQIVDVYSGETNPQDSQAINILNTCGPVSILGGTLVAGSENLLLGGDSFKLRDCPEGVVADVLVDGVTLTKPDKWRIEQTRVAPKNILEVKAGKRVTVRKSFIAGSYRGTSASGATQDGSCIVITPKNSQYIETVLFESNTIERCAQGAQLMGRDYRSLTPKVTTGVVFRGNRWTIDGTTYKGRGVLALVVGGMADALFENETVLHTGGSLFLVDSRSLTGPVTIRNSRMTTGRLVCAAPGVNYCGPAPTGRPQFSLVAEGNTFADAPKQFKALYPKNTWITRAELLAMK